MSVGSLFGMIYSEIRSMHNFENVLKEIKSLNCLILKGELYGV